MIAKPHLLFEGLGAEETLGNGQSELVGLKAIQRESNAHDVFVEVPTSEYSDVIYITRDCLVS